MKKISLIFLLLLFTFSSAQAQEDNPLENTTWELQNEDNEVYLKFQEGNIFQVWHVVRDRQCAMYPSTYLFDGNKIVTDDQRGKNMTWNVQYIRADSMRINFPNGATAKYKKSTFYPRVKCDMKGEGGRKL